MSTYENFISNLTGKQLLGHNNVMSLNKTACHEKLPDFNGGRIVRLREDGFSYHEIGQNASTIMNT